MSKRATVEDKAWNLGGQSAIVLAILLAALCLYLTFDAGQHAVPFEIVASKVQ